MSFTPTRLEVLNSFEINMRKLLRAQNLSREHFMRDMLIVSKYVGAIKDGVFIAEEIKNSFTVFLPLVEQQWHEASYEPLIQVTEKYASILAQHLEKQQSLFEQVSVIISALDMNDTTEEVKMCITSTIAPITVEFKLMKLLCQIHQLLFQKDQESFYKAIDDFLQELKELDSFATQPLIQLRGLIEQCRVVAAMPTEATFIKHLLERVIEIAQTFVISFCCV